MIRSTEREYIEYDKSDLKGALQYGFEYLEKRDEIVGMVVTNPSLLKKIILTVPEDIEFAFIPEGVGMIRTAYLKLMPGVQSNEIRFTNVEKSISVRLFLT
jgi:hypothetical protein